MQHVLDNILRLCGILGLIAIFLLLQERAVFAKNLRFSPRQGYPTPSFSIPFLRLIDRMVDEQSRAQNLFSFLIFPFTSYRHKRKGVRL